MGSNSTQGLATLVFLVAFTLLSLSFFHDGSLLFLALFVVALAVSIGLFLKCKPWEHAGGHQ